MSARKNYASNLASSPIYYYVLYGAQTRSRRLWKVGSGSEINHSESTVHRKRTEKYEDD
jgi:hypothetical protein